MILLEPDQPRVRTFEKLQRDDAEQTLQPAVTAKKKKSIDIQLDRVSFVCFFFCCRTTNKIIRLLGDRDRIFVPNHARSYIRMATVPTRFFFIRSTLGQQDRSQYFSTGGGCMYRYVHRVK